MNFQQNCKDMRAPPHTHTHTHMLLKSTPCNSSHVSVTVFMFEIRHNLRDFSDIWQICRPTLLRTCIYGNITQTEVFKNVPCNSRFSTNVQCNSIFSTNVPCNSRFSTNNYFKKYLLVIYIHMLR